MNVTLKIREPVIPDSHVPGITSEHRDNFWIGIAPTEKKALLELAWLSNNQSLSYSDMVMNVS